MLQARPQTDYHPRVSYSFIYTYFIYILGKDLNPTIAGSARINVKKKDEKERTKEQMDRGRGRNLPPHLWQVMR